MTTRNRETCTYKRKGYVVTHDVQRMDSCHSHRFVIHDFGAICIPKARHLIRVFIPLKLRCGKVRKIISVAKGVHDTRSIWYKIDIQYKMQR